MAREVPRNRPLSDEDREYLLSRGYDSTVASIDQNFPSGDAPSEVTGGSQVVKEPVVDDEDDYDDWTGPELEGELRKRGLPVSGTNPQKVERLRADDVARAQQS